VAALVDRATTLSPAIPTLRPSSVDATRLRRPDISRKIRRASTWYRRPTRHHNSAAPANHTANTTGTLDKPRPAANRIPIKRTAAINHTNRRPPVEFVVARVPVAAAASPGEGASSWRTRTITIARATVPASVRSVAGPREVASRPASSTTPTRTRPDNPISALGGSFPAPHTSSQYPTYTPLRITSAPSTKTTPVAISDRLDQMAVSLKNAWNPFPSSKPKAPPNVAPREPSPMIAPSDRPPVRTRAATSSVSSAHPATQPTAPRFHAVTMFPGGFSAPHPNGSHTSLRISMISDASAAPTATAP